MKVVTIIGARPQFIKAAVVSRAINEFDTSLPQDKNSIKEVIIHTGQHYDRNMSDVFFEEMKIPRPDHYLDIHGLTHGAMTGRMLEKIEAVLMVEKPDWVLVYGDTNTTLAGALAAAKLHLPLAHVEAGLRSYNRLMPEEVNRVMADHLSAILFCPTTDAVENLKKEGIPDPRNAAARVYQVGDVMLDAFLFYRKLQRKPLVNIPAQFSLATVHRSENTDCKDRLLSIMSAFERLSHELPIIFPIHPRTRAILSDLNWSSSSKNLQIIEPLSYLEMVYLLDRCELVLTDSGGLQKEAFFFKKPCLTLRDETEWVELVSNGFNFLTGASADRIINSYNALLSKGINFNLELYGHGSAGASIVRILHTYTC
jgi:UDP-GlcNAc3NAcA epimerase